MFAATRSSASSSRFWSFDLESSGALDGSVKIFAWNMVDEVGELVVRCVTKRHIRHVPITRVFVQHVGYSCLLL